MARSGVLASFDIGNGYAKARSAGAKLSFPSVLSEMNTTLDGFEFTLSPNSSFVVGYRGVKYAIGDSVRYLGLTPQTIAHHSRIEMEYYRVLFAAALSEAVVQNARISPVMSLPPAAYWERDKLKSALAGVYEVERITHHGTRVFRYDVPIESIRVIPEGMGTVCALVLNEAGQPTGASNLAETIVGIVDVGTYTTDFIQLDGLRIVRAGCDTLTHALHDIHTRLRNYAATTGHMLDAYRADQVLIDGYFLVGGKRHAITEQRDQWAGELARTISGTIRTLWNGGDDVEHILITGGGAALVARTLAMEFPHVRLVDTDPFFANSEGGYRYGLLRASEG